MLEIVDIQMVGTPRKRTLEPCLECEDLWLNQGKEWSGRHSRCKSNLCLSGQQASYEPVWSSMVMTERLFGKILMLGGLCPSSKGTIRVKDMPVFRRRIIRALNCSNTKDQILLFREEMLIPYLVELSKLLAEAQEKEVDLVWR